jgi:hypothetical protein
MTPLELHQRAIEFTMRRKEHHLATRGPNTTPDTVPMIVLGKNDRYVGAVAPIVDRDLALDMLYIGTQVLQPDIVVLVIEGYGRMQVPGKEEEMAESARQYQPGQFKQEFEAGLEGRYEMMVVHTVTLDGPNHQWTRPFVVKGTEVEWVGRSMEHHSDVPESMEMKGFIPVALSDIMSTPMPDRLVEGLKVLRSIDPRMTTRSLTVLALERIFGAGCRSGDIDEVLPASL